MGKININKFVKVYVSATLNLIKKRKEMSHSEFEDFVWERVSEKVGISKEDVVYLHHCFHWTFFNREEDSPFRYIQPKGKGSVPMVGLNGRKINKSALVNHILENYKEPYLTTRAKQL